MSSNCNDGSKPPRRVRPEQAKVRALREALEPYIDLKELRRLAAVGADLRGALATTNAPAEVQALLKTLATLLHAGEERLQIKSPTDAAQLMQLEMSHFDQEHLRVICLDTKNRVQKIQTVYIGSVNSAAVRVGEIFKEALKLNSTAIIVVHNHPSGDPTPSAEDMLVTKQIVEAGKLLDVDVLDHLVIGHGRFASLRERGLGFKGREGF